MADSQATYDTASGSTSTTAKLKSTLWDGKRKYCTIIVAVLCVLLLIFIISTISASVQLDDCKKGHFHGSLTNSSNLHNGSNNPLWNMQSGNAGHGGSMDSWRPAGSSRPQAASAEGAHMHTRGHAAGPLDCNGQSGKAREDAQFMQDQGSSSSSLTDDALNGVLHGVHH